MVKAEYVDGGDMVGYSLRNFSDELEKNPDIMMGI